MATMRSLFIQLAPYWVQDLAVSYYSWKLNRPRRSGSYAASKEFFSRMQKASNREIGQIASARLVQFLDYACKNSQWFNTVNSTSLSDFAILEKRDVIQNLDRIRTIDERDAIVSLTGGTTGASMKVLYDPSDMQERIALLDFFREQFGYRWGAKTAWFSGKSIVTPEDVKIGRCYRDDLFNKIRYFSTFHVNVANFDSYWKALNKFEPEFIVGFPSSIYEICIIAKERGLSLKNPVRVYFPTAETVLAVHRETISAVLGCTVADQYASSEGAPFILQCSAGRMHMYPLSGIFEVVDDDGQPAREGEMIVTSFTTKGTPLIRYRIGDRVALEDETFVCSCGSEHPAIKWLEGRTTDFVWSPENGKVSLSNLSNATKDVAGIICFQISQKERNSISVSVVASDAFDSNERKKFVEALRLRVGEKMKIHLKLVDEIPRERSGKFRVLKNSLVEMRSFSEVEDSVCHN